MKGICLKLYTYEFQKHQGILLHEWLLEFARKSGLHGGSAFRAVAGFGRHGVMHEEHFYELASNVPVEVVFLITDEEAERFLGLLKNEKINFFYAKIPAEYGAINNGSST